MRVGNIIGPLLRGEIEEFILMRVVHIAVGRLVDQHGMAGQPVQQVGAQVDHRPASNPRHIVGHAAGPENGDPFRLLRDIQKVVAGKHVADPQVGRDRRARLHLRAVRLNPDLMRRHRGPACDGQGDSEAQTACRGRGQPAPATKKTIYNVHLLA